MAQEKRLLISNNNGSLSLADLARTAVSRYSGSLYIPNDANCFQDSAGTTPATKDSVVGKLLDSVGTNHATQATTGYKPILRKGAKNLLSQSQNFSFAANKWSYGGTGRGASASAQYLQSNGGVLYVYQDESLGLNRVLAGLNYTAQAKVKVPAGQGTTTVGFRIGRAAGAFVFTNSAWQNIPEDGEWHVITATMAAPSITGAQTGSSFIIRTQNADEVALHCEYMMFETGSTASTYVATTSAPASNGIGPWWLDYDGADDVLAAGAFGAGFASSTIIRANYGAAQTTTTGQDLSAGYNMTTDTAGIIIVPDTVSASDLAVLQRYANLLGGYSA